MSKKHVIFLIILFFIGIAGLTYYFNGPSSEELIDCDTNKAKEFEKTSDILSGVSSENISEEDTDEQNLSKEDVSSKNTKDKSAKSLDDSSSTDKVGIWVHVCGEVREPGVYELKNKEARVIDAIKAADGLTKKASLWAVNQAELVTDGQQIYIPSKKEVTKDAVSSTSSSESISSTIAKTDSKVNINTASEEELITLPGIGQAKAQKIVDYRANNGKFSKIEDIMNIPGIKEGLFNKISENITV